LWRFWYYRGNSAEGRGWLVGAVARNAEAAAAIRAKALNGLAVLALGIGDLETAQNANDQCLILRRDLGSKRGIADTLNNLGMLARRRQQFAESERLYSEALDIYRNLDDKAGVARVAINLGNVALETHRYREAEHLF